MRRGFSIFLILLFGVGPLSAMVDGSDDAGLPPCCSRHGAHHCAMAMQMAMMGRTPDRRHSFTVPLTCPLYPGLSFSMLIPAHALTAAPAPPQVALVGALAPAPAAADAHPAPSRTHSGRGPPMVDSQLIS